MIETIEASVLASLTKGPEKLIRIKHASSKLDLTKFFLQTAWEAKAIDTKKYALISEPVNEVGRMLGGWLRQTEIKPNPREVR